MATELTQEILQYISRATGRTDGRTEEEREETQEKLAADKISAILSSQNARAQDVEAVHSFMEESPVNRKKILSFCLDFRDPAQPQTTVQNGEEVVLNAFLAEDELSKLRGFVKRHKNDVSFGEVVYNIMDKHGTTGPKVYNGVFMSRQDFSRVTDPRCKSVTRKMAWQIIIGLHCTLEEADAVLFSAGYIRNNSELDLTMQYFIERGNYDIIAINAVLEELHLKMFNC